MSKSIGFWPNQQIMDVFLQRFVCILLLSLCLITSLALSSVETPLRWCVNSDLEEEKCRAMSNAFTAHKLKPTILCVLSATTEVSSSSPSSGHSACLRTLAKGEADVTSVKGVEVGVASKKFRLQGIMAENYPGPGDTIAPLDHYAVAVAWADSNITVDTLKGTRSCHPSVHSPSAFAIPLSVLLRRGLMTQMDCTSPLVSAAGFFGNSCIPGVLDISANPAGLNVSSLCSLCDGTGSDNCASSSYEFFYGEQGAFRCLVGLSSQPYYSTEGNQQQKSGRADVAFLRHDTILKMTVTREQITSKDLSTLDRLRLFNKRLRSEFVLLCPEGGSAPVEQYSTCNWGEVKANLLMVPAHSERKKEITQLVEKGLTTALSFGGASVAQVIKMMEFQSEVYLDTLVILLGTSDVSRAPVTPENKWPR
ncbi:transferrin-like [Symsagittifera roscoffensis]|uniref:transferrin-like n=1 Tax=Symsagittifera roscoffensis TaxID=84072 RepID=UPI00307C5863